eukprot:jgi/Chlat1/1504/Chrsp12S02045
MKRGAMLALAAFAFFALAAVSATEPPPPPPFSPPPPPPSPSPPPPPPTWVPEPAPAPAPNASCPDGMMVWTDGVRCVCPFGYEYFPEGDSICKELECPEGTSVAQDEWGNSFCAQMPCAPGTVQIPTDTGFTCGPPPDFKATCPSNVTGCVVENWCETCDASCEYCQGQSPMCGPNDCFTCPEDAELTLTGNPMRTGYCTVPVPPVAVFIPTCQEFISVPKNAQAGFADAKNAPRPPFNGEITCSVLPPPPTADAPPPTADAPQDHRRRR